MPKVLFGLGSNLGDREAILNKAVERFREFFDVLAVSTWFTYPAIGGPGEQGDFLNGAIVAETSLSPSEVHQRLQLIEQEAGRERTVRWSSRTLDCDLLLYGEFEVWTEELKVPHPRMITRKFVLEPASDVACDMLHPTCGLSIGELFHHMQSAPNYFCILSSDHNASQRLSQQISEKTSCLLLDQHAPFTGSSYEEAIEWSASAANRFASSLGEMTHADRGCVGNLWIWEPWLKPISQAWEKPEHVSVAVPTPDPKLLIVVDDKTSDFGGFLGTRAKELKVPTLFLSQDPKDALQDAVGAVLSMMM